MKAIGKRVLIDATPLEEKTAGGIYIPVQVLEKQGDKPSKGTVLSVGDEVTTVKVGDYIHFNMYTPVKIKAKDGKEYLVIKEEEIYTIE